ncbi:hypothetical protein OEZ86_007853 [Tetradesmus obliquus]|nr:hypothetical protein OEZ86_007853 [Tetradesmus obliquus]
MWLFQGVLNAGLQILLSIFGGWLCAWLKLVDPEVLSRQLNAFAMRAAFPAFIIHLLGIKTDLQDLEAWKALGVFILWVFLIHMCCIAWHKLRGGSSTAQTLGINCLLLTTNNTGCIGWPVLIATVGRQGAALSMLLGVLFFVQLLPAAITCFEYHKFLQEHQLEGSTSNKAAADESAAPEQALLPTTMGQAKQQKEEQAATGFPHEFRYCYWSNADYVPSKPAAAAGTGSIKDDVRAPAGDNARPYPNYVEVSSSPNSKGKTKLSSVAHGAATAAGSAGASCVGDLEVKEEVVHHRGCFGAFMRNHPLLVHITAVQLKSFHLWLNVIAIALSVSGARKYLDADSPLALPALGWLDGVLGWFSSACIPVLLFANGVWMVGKDITGGKRGQIQVSLLLLLKLALLPGLMVGLTQLFHMRGTYGLSLVLLSSCPLAPLAFLVCQQYGVGAELATSVTIQGVLLMLPQMMAVIKISQVAGLYDVDLLKAA